MAKIPFLIVFLKPNMDTEVGVVIYMYLIHPHIKLIPIIYGFMRLIP